MAKDVGLCCIVSVSRMSETCAHVFRGRNGTAEADVLVEMLEKRCGPFRGRRHAATCDLQEDEF